jgi:lysozyme
MNRKPVFDILRTLKREWTRDPDATLHPDEVTRMDNAITSAEQGGTATGGIQTAAGALATPHGAEIKPLGTFDRALMREELIRDEGERLKAYRDTVGKWTIGVGRNLDDCGIFPHEAAALGITTASVKANGITKEQSAALLDSDIDRVTDGLDKKLPWWRKLDPVRQRVVINMAFNMGTDGLLGFKNTLRMIDQRDYAGASQGMLASKWARQVGARAARLATMMRQGTQA